MLRERLKYPPFCDIIMVTFSSSLEEQAKKMANKWYEYLKCKELLIYPPMPAPISKIKNKHRFRIIIKCNFSNRIINLLNEVLEKQETWRIKTVRVSIDVNPSNMM